MIRSLLSRVLRRGGPASPPPPPVPSGPIRVPGPISLVPVLDAGPSARHSMTVLSPDQADFVRIDGEPDATFLRGLLADAGCGIHKLHPLDGGYALVAGDEVLFHPQCCGDLGDLGQWRVALEPGDGVWREIWIGHPCLLALRDGGDVLLSGYVEPGLGLPRPPPELRTYRIAAVNLAAAIASAEAACRAAVPVLAGLLPAPSERSTSILLGLDPDAPPAVPSGSGREAVRAAGPNAAHPPLRDQVLGTHFAKEPSA